MKNPETKVISIAILKAKPGKRDKLKSGLLALIEPTRAEAGNLDYVLFEVKEQSGVFYMREAFLSHAALEAHLSTPHFLKFKETLDEVLQEPIELVFLDQLSD